MYSKILSSTIIASALLAGATSALAQNAHPDIAVYYLLSPTTCAKCDQSVQFYPMNYGKAAIEQFEAHVYKNGELLFTEQVDQHIGPNDWISEPVRLQNTVHLDYEEDAMVSMRLVVEGDTDTSNDSTTMHITMPKLMDYPFVWSRENSQINFRNSGLDYLDWQYDEERDAYYMSDRVTNWMGTLTSDALPFPEGEAVRCSFEYGTSGGDITLFFTLDYGDNYIETDTLMVGQSIYDFSPTYFTFRAKGPAIVKVTATMAGAWNASGAIYLRNICFQQASKDLIVKEILQPLGNSSPINTDLPVAARFVNPSTDPISQPTFCYDAGWGTVREVYEGTIEAGSSLDYTFAQHLCVAEPCTRQLKVWCEVEDDSDESNDLLTRQMKYYEALAFPYQTTFDTGNDLWTAIDDNGDGQTFAIELMPNNDMAADFWNYAANDINDRLVSPVILIPKGKHRVDFNFACYNAQRSVNLKLYLCPLSGEPQELFSRDLDSQLWQTGYQLFDMPAEGLCAFTFVAQGASDAVVIDNFKVDDGEDLGIIGISFGTISDYNLQSTTVTISYANFGMSAQQNVELGYGINDRQMVTETNPATIQPGDTLTYTFSTLADISTVGQTYELYGMLINPTGDEEINDYAAAQPIVNQAARELPYFCDFGDEEQTAQWLLQSNHNDYYSGWQTTYMSGSYSTLGVLRHSNWDTQASDSWAYSEGIAMTPGQYEVSYFHHEAEWFDGPDYVQDFELRMGQQRTPEAMNIAVDRQQKVDVCFGPYVKVVQVVDIPTAGIYYLGFHNTSAANYGSTTIDDVHIEALTQGQALPYASDFAGADSLQWSFYDPNNWYYLQWQNQDGVLVADRTEENDAWTDPEGMVVSPKLHFDADRVVDITIDYEVITADSKLTLGLYGGTVNNSATMNLLTALPADDTQFTYQLQTGVKAKDYYLGFRSNTLHDGTQDYSYGPFYTLSISSVHVAYDASEAIGSIGSDQRPTIELRDLAGRLMATGTNAIEQLRASGQRGIFVLRTITKQGISARKVEIE